MRSVFLVGESEVSSFPWPMRTMCPTDPCYGLGTQPTQDKQTRVWLHALENAELSLLCTWPFPKVNLRGWWKRRSERARRRPSIRCRAEVATDLHARPPARAIGRLRTCRTEMGMILFGSYFAAAREIQRWRAVALAPKRRTEQNSVEPESFPKCRRLKPSLPCPVDSSHMLPVTPLRGPRFAQTAAARCQRRQGLVK